MNGSRLSGQVRIVGAGLLGASVGLALTAKGLDVIVDDSSPAALGLAIDYGAGRAGQDSDNPQLVVVAVPPRSRLCGPSRSTASMAAITAAAASA